MLLTIFATIFVMGTRTLCPGYFACRLKVEPAGFLPGVSLEFLCLGWCFWKCDFSLVVSTMLLSMPLSHWRTNVSCLILPHYPTLSVFWSGRGFPRSGFTVRFRPLCTLHTNMEWIIRLGIVHCLSERKLQLIFEVNLPKNNPLGLISEAGVREI